MDNDLRELERRLQRDPSRTNVLRLIKALVRSNTQLRTFFIPYIVPYQTRNQDIFDFGFIVVGPLAFEPILDGILHTQEIGLTSRSYEKTSESIRHGLSCKIYPVFQTEEERDNFLREFVVATEAACEFTPIIRSASEFNWEISNTPRGSRQYLLKKIFRSHITDSIHQPKIVISFRNNFEPARYSDIRIYLPFSWAEEGDAFFNNFFGPWPGQIDPNRSGPRRWREWEPGVFIDNPLEGYASQHLGRGPVTLEAAIADAAHLKRIVDLHFNTTSEIIINDLRTSRRNPDESLRLLQRKALSGDINAGAKFLLSKYRSGSLDPQSKILRLAAHLGHPAAVKFYQQIDPELDLFFSILFRSVTPNEPDLYGGFDVETSNRHRASEHLVGSEAEILEMSQEQRLRHFQGIWWFFMPVLVHHTGSGELYTNLFTDYCERHSLTFLQRTGEDQLHALDFLRDPELYIDHSRGFLMELLWYCLWIPSSTPEGERRIPRWIEHVQTFIRQMFSTRASEALIYRRDALDVALYQLDLHESFNLYQLARHLGEIAT